MRASHFEDQNLKQHTIRVLVFKVIHILPNLQNIFSVCLSICSKVLFLIEDWVWGKIAANEEYGRNFNFLGTFHFREHISEFTLESAKNYKLNFVMQLK